MAIVNRAHCDHCVKTRMLRQGKTDGPHEPRAIDPRSAIHLDVVEVKPATPEGYKYFVPFFDEVIGDLKIYGLKRCHAQAVIAAARQHSIDVGGISEGATYYVDRATQCRSKLWQQMNLETGTKTKFSTPYNQWLNGLVERMIRDVFEKGKVMVSAAHPKVPQNLDVPANSCG